LSFNEHFPMEGGSGNADPRGITACVPIANPGVSVHLEIGGFSRSSVDRPSSSVRRFRRPGWDPPAVFPPNRPYPASILAVLSPAYATVIWSTR
jgi:hypothetical protein